MAGKTPVAHVGFATVRFKFETEKQCHRYSAFSYAIHRCLVLKRQIRDRLHHLHGTARDGRRSPAPGRSGQVRNGALLTPTFGVQIYYDPPPRPLTRGQLARTFCGLTSRIVAELRPPPPEGEYYIHAGFTVDQELCRSPYEVPADAPAPATVAEARRLYDIARADVRSEQVAGAFITASLYDVAGDRFTVEADVGEWLGQECTRCRCGPRWMESWR